MNNRTLDLIEQATACLDEALSGDAISGLSSTELTEVLAASGRLLRLTEAVTVESLASVEAGFEHASGCRSQNELVQRALRVDAAQANRFGKAAQATLRSMNLSSGERMPARWPALREALLDGVIGVSGLLAAIGPLEEVHYRIGTPERLLADADLAAYARGEYASDPADESGTDLGDHDRDGDGDNLERDSDDDRDDGDRDDGDNGDNAGFDSQPDVDDAAPGRRRRRPAATAEDLKQTAQAWVMVLDPDGAEPTDREAQAKRSFTISILRDGLHRVQGHLLPEVAAQLQLIFDAYNNPKVGGAPEPAGVSFRPSEAEPSDDPFNSDPRERIDNRTATQKRHDALAAALGIAARHEDMPHLGGAAPTLVVQVNAADYISGRGWATVARTLAPVPLSVAAHTACAGGVQRVLFDEGRIVGISVSDRIFTAHQRRAIVLRDKECLIPGCHVPASWCEIHHVIEHQDGGPTDTSNGVPLCWWHHRNLDPSTWQIRMVGGRPQILGPWWWDPDQIWRTPRRSLPDDILAGDVFAGAP